ncbi:MAG: FAD-binding oxidoreductase [Gemmatimonadota bacterium]|nr:MAG: FAD-binding oxidoreductase [Gemmatimonadota bacterium]
MNALAAVLSERLPEGQVVEGFRAEQWAVCDRVPQAVVFPESEAEVAEVLRLASQEGWTVVPAGKGTWLHGGHPPGAVDIVLSIVRMDRITLYEPGDLTVTAEGGIGLDLLARRCDDHRQWLPLDPPGPRKGTLAATVSTASSGPLAYHHGSPKDHVLGVSLVTGDGRVLELGGRVVKNVAGFDVLKLAIGSWGTLGVLTSITTRLHPQPPADRTVLFRGEAAELVALARAIATVPAPLAALEMLLPGERERSGGPVPLLAVRILEASEATDEICRIVTDTAGAAAFRQLDGRASADLFGNVEALESGAELVVRLRLLPSQLETVCQHADELRELADPDEGWGTRLGAHVQSGALRVIMSRMARGEGWIDRAAEVIERVRRGLEAEGGSLTLSRGPSELVSAVGAWGDAGSAAPLMSALKREFDPAGILSPGRLCFL